MKEIPWNFKFEQIIDIEFGIMTFQSWETYFWMLSKFEDGMMPIFEKVKQCVLELQYSLFWDSIHSIKGGLSYCAAGRFYEVCF